MKNTTNTMGQIQSLTLSLLMEDLASMCEKNAILQDENEALNDLIDDIVPKFKYLEDLLENQATFTTSEIAEMHEMSAYKLNGILHRLGIQCKVNGKWVLNKPYCDMHYTTVEHAVCTTCGTKAIRSKWTHKGRIFIAEIIEFQAQAAEIMRSVNAPSVPNYILDVIVFVLEHGSWKGTATQLLMEIGQIWIEPNVFARQLNKFYDSVIRPNRIKMRRTRIQSGRFIELFVV